MDNFLREYKKLNTAQKDAVDSIDGPVMVVAGPGTGKSQVLALRIANILDKTDTPDNGVLCLTFTNAGVHAMRERLSKLMGSRGSRVVVSTFHAFAKNLIDKYYPLVGFDEMPVILDDILVQFDDAAAAASLRVLAATTCATMAKAGKSSPNPPPMKPFWRP